MSFPTTNLHTGDRWSEGYKNYEWNGSSWEENEICIPEHHWKFNELSTDVYVSDSGSIPKQLSKTGDVTYGNVGHINKSVEIGNTTDYMTSSTSEAFTYNGMTISAWVNRKDNNRNSAIYSRYHQSTSYAGTYILLYPTVIRFRFGENYEELNYTLIENEWYNITISYRSDATNTNENTDEIVCYYKQLVTYIEHIH